MLNEKQTVNVEAREIVRKNMLKIAPELGRVPHYLYHASPVGNHAAIEVEGLTSSPLFGDVYFTLTRNQTLQFVPRPCYIYKIDTAALEQNLLRESLDYGHFCCVYFDDVPASAIVQAKLYK